jgi:hypothetical protein
LRTERLLAERLLAERLLAERLLAGRSSTFTATPARASIHWQVPNPLCVRPRPAA